MKKIDIYVDEDKKNWKLWFLVIKNTPNFQNLLYEERQKSNIYYELHFKELNNTSIILARKFLNLFLNLDFCYFSIRNWYKKENKFNVIKSFVEEIIKKEKTKNIVLFLDFDTEHKKYNLENNLTKKLWILRVFQLDSKSTDLLQLTDLLLATTVRWEKWLLSEEDFYNFKNKIELKEKLTKSILKSYLSSYVYFNDKNWKIKK